jgi:hypothetical protein
MHAAANAASPPLGRQSEAPSLDALWQTSTRQHKNTCKKHVHYVLKKVTRTKKKKKRSKPMGMQPDSKCGARFIIHVGHHMPSFRICGKHVSALFACRRLK